MTDSHAANPAAPSARILAGAAPALEPLRALTESLAQVGWAAREDDAFGPAWTCWADWCWAAGVPALPATAQTAQAFVADAAGALPEVEDLLEVIAAVTDRHRFAGHPDPFTGGQR